MHKEETQVTIEKVNAETIEDFLGLITKLAEYEKLSPPDKEAKNRLRHDCLSITPKYQAFLGKVGERYVAYVIYFFTYSSFLALPTLYLEDLFVLQEYRHLGVGKTLFNFIKATAKQEGCGRIEFTVLTWNKSAQQFYAKNKAKCLEDWYFYRITKEDF
jgi:GNAT superfamily N-acetyltransferase